MHWNWPILLLAGLLIIMVSLKDTPLVQAATNATDVASTPSKSVAATPSVTSSLASATATDATTGTTDQPSTPFVKSTTFIIIIAVVVGVVFFAILFTVIFRIRRRRQMKKRQVNKWRNLFDKPSLSRKADRPSPLAPHPASTPKGAVATPAVAPPQEYMLEETEAWVPVSEARDLPPVPAARPSIPPRQMV